MTSFTSAAEVDVNAYYFAGRDMQSYPRRAFVRGHQVTFRDGLRVRLGTEGHTSYVYNMMSESGHCYRLRQDGNQWTLVGVR